MADLSRTKLQPYKKLISGTGVGLLALSLVACGGDDGNENIENNDTTAIESPAEEADVPADVDESEPDDSQEEETASDEEPFSDPGFVADKATTFFAEAGEIGIDFDALEQVSSDEEQLEWAEERFQDLVIEYFNVGESSDSTELRNEYSMALMAAMYSHNMGEATGGLVEMEIEPPRFLAEYTEIDTENRTASSPTFFFEMLREVDESGTYADMDDVEMGQYLIDTGATLPVHLEYVDGIWFLDAENTVAEMEPSVEGSVDIDAYAEVELQDN